MISLIEVLQQLRDERSRIDEAIARIESRLTRAAGVHSNQGRKGMGQDERKVVAERMKRYWEQRRQARG